MSAKSKLIAPGAESFMNKHKEEIAEEFGTHASPANRDIVTPKILEDREDEKGKDRTNEDMV